MKNTNNIHPNSQELNDENSYEQDFIIYSETPLLRFESIKMARIFTELTELLSNLTIILVLYYTAFYLEFVTKNIKNDFFTVILMFFSTLFLDASDVFIIVTGFLLSFLLEYANFDKARWQLLGWIYSDVQVSSLSSVLLFFVFCLVQNFVNINFSSSLFTFIASASSTFLQIPYLNLYNLNMSSQLPIVISQCCFTLPYFLHTVHYLQQKQLMSAFFIFCVYTCLRIIFSAIIITQQQQPLFYVFSMFLFILDFFGGSIFFVCRRITFNVIEDLHLSWVLIICVLFSYLCALFSMSQKMEVTSFSHEFIANQTCVRFSHISPCHNIPSLGLVRGPILAFFSIAHIARNHFQNDHCDEDATEQEDFKNSVMVDLNATECLLTRFNNISSFLNMITPFSLFWIILIQTLMPDELFCAVRFCLFGCIVPLSFLFFMRFYLILKNKHQQQFVKQVMIFLKKNITFNAQNTPAFVLANFPSSRQVEHKNEALPLSCDLEGEPG